MRKKDNPLPERLSRELAANQPVHQEYTTRAFHAVNPGDLIACMGAIKKYHDVTKRRVVVSQSLTHPGQYYPGATHPTVNERNEPVCCNEPMWNMLKPLIEHQSYIHSFEKYEGQKIDLDFNVIRGKTNVNLPNGSIQGWVPLAYPDLDFDISQPWMEVRGKCPKRISKQINGKIILNFTERYRNPLIDYFFLKNYAPDLIFAGTEREHFLFCNKWQLTIPRLDVKDFLELGYAIRDCRFILANQSFCVNVAYAIGKPRIVEICAFAQNVIHMIGPHCHGFLYQAGVEYYFRKLYNEFK